MGKVRETVPRITPVSRVGQEVRSRLGGHRPGCCVEKLRRPSTVVPMSTRGPQATTVTTQE
jgi:hypothetical protein